LLRTEVVNLNRIASVSQIISGVVNLTGACSQETERPKDGKSERREDRKTGRREVGKTESREVGKSGSRKDGKTGSPAEYVNRWNGRRPMIEKQWLIS